MRLRAASGRRPNRRMLRIRQVRRGITHWAHVELHSSDTSEQTSAIISYASYGNVDLHVMPVAAAKEKLVCAAIQLLATITCG